jgi:hypothetical protein
MLDLNKEGPEFHSVVTSPAAAGLPQFATAEYAHIPGTERCQICGNLIPGEYYRINNLMACVNCATQASAGRPMDSHAAFVRGLLLGTGAAVLGLAVYAAFTIVTHIYLGYLALGVGWLVATAIMKGSGGIGGRRYQIAAVLLTYAAISMAAVPIGISLAIQHHRQAASHTVSSDTSPQNPTPGTIQPSASGPKMKIGLGPLIAKFAIMGLASPFLELSSPIQGAIALLILFIGLRIAWQLTGAKTLPIEGPYGPAAA